MAVIFRRNKDTEGENQVNQRLGEDRGVNMGAWLQAGCLLWHAGDATRARDVINKVLDSEMEYRDEYTSVQLIRGWIDLTAGRGAYLEKCVTMFDKVLQAEQESDLLDIDASMGKIAYLERKSQFFPAQDLQNKVMVKYPQFTPVYISKAKQLMKSEDWEQATEVLGRVLAKDDKNVEALILTILHILVKEAKYTVAAQHISTLREALMMREPRNGQLFHTCAQCFARLSGGSAAILTVTAQLAEHAVQMRPNSAEYQATVASLLLLNGDVKSAHAVFKKATAASEDSITPMLGLIKCTIIAGKFKEASEQINFLQEIQSNGPRNAELLYLHAMVLWGGPERSQEKSIEKLDQAVEAHKADIALQPAGAELYVKLNPPLIIDIAREYMQQCRTEPPEPGTNRTDPNAEKARRVLEVLIRNVPGHTEAKLLASKVAFIGGETNKAAAMITDCLRQDNSNPEAYLLQAQICQYLNQNSNAKQALEQALALDFDVKDMPLYNLLKGTNQLRTQEYDAALATLQIAMKKVTEGSGAAAANSNSKLARFTLGVQDHVSLYLHIAQCYLKLKQNKEAKDTIDQASAAFLNTTQFGRVSIARAMIVSLTDVDAALEILRSVAPESEFYIAAKARMANIYLTQRHNRRMFARCFEELVESFPSVQSLIHLGEAYSSIQEPEKAILAFEKARALDPNNTDLAVRIGRTLATTHDYTRAQRYYKEAITGDPTLFSLRQDLAILQWRLGERDKAIATLTESPVMKNTKNVQTEDIDQSIERVNIALIMFKIHRSANKLTQASEALIQARVYQNTLVARLRNETQDVVEQQRKIAASICFELGETYLKLNQPDKAVTCYNEALKLEETNEKAMLALAKLYLSRGEVDGCEQQCNGLIRVNPSCEDAIMILADISFRRNRLDDAAHHFSQLLDKDPNNFSVMVQYVQLLKRSGKLADAPAVFAKAEASMRPGQKPDPGLLYCKGLHERFTNNSAEALKLFNQGRYPKDGPFGEKCLIAMIEIFILPDNENLWEDTGSDIKDNVTENLRNAESLIKEVKDPFRRAMLEGYWLVAHKKKDTLERALQKFYEISNDESLKPENSTSDATADQLASQSASGGGDDEGATDSSRVNVPALVGLAITLQMMKQTPKARNFLKRVSKANYNPAVDDDHERGWLLLADIYIQNGKYDLALDVLKRATQANKSCSRAWEYMGLVYEKEQSFKDAADYYEKAWKLLNERDAAIGFKLAFNFLKAKKMIPAIDVCHKVLAVHPNYPKIQKEVLERARLSLKQ
eukprot:GILJ01014162.1.p1 GENE.GILJ01014162.1~~GILJ01014162.1.p1  ORF type:complete len:1286 (+),score=269.23 GILJ01014162.1:27-3860(+)